MVKNLLRNQLKRLLPMSEDKVVIYIQFGAIIILIALMIVKRMPFSLDRFGLIVIAATMWHKKGRGFVKAFLPFFLLIYSYGFLNGYAHQLTHDRIHIQDLIFWERKLFHGLIPSAILQKWLPLDSFLTRLIWGISNWLYFSHYALPFIIALVFWNVNRFIYWQFMVGFLLMNYAGFISWALFPAAPPWWATYFNYLSGDLAVANISAISTKFLLSAPNPVAAMPSLHAAYPTLIALFFLSAWGRKAMAIILLPLGVGFAAVYLGHHYVIDILAGYAYAVAAFFIVKYLTSQRKRVWNLINNIQSKWLTHNSGND